MPNKSWTFFSSLELPESPASLYEIEAVAHRHGLQRIVGVDDDQALELSEMFVGMMFDHHDIDVVEVKAL